MSRAQLYRTTTKVLPYQELAHMTPTLLSPPAVIAALMACWRFGADTGWTDAFFVTDGLMSHWQVWLALAIGIQYLAHRLDAYTKQR